MRKHLWEHSGRFDTNTYCSLKIHTRVRTDLNFDRLRRNVNKALYPLRLGYIDAHELLMGLGINYFEWHERLSMLYALH